MHRSKLVIATLIATVALLAPGVASAQVYPPPATGGLTLGETTVAPGGGTVISGSGFLPGSTVTIRIGDTVLGTTVADAQGNFSATVNVPASFGTGRFTITASGVDDDGNPVALASVLTVSTAGTGTATGPGATGALPRTGADSTVELGQVALAMVALGSVMVALVWRRRNVAEATTRSSVDA